MMRYGYWTSVVLFSFCLGAIFGSRELFTQLLKPKIILICSSEECFPETLKAFKKLSGIRIQTETYKNSTELKNLLTKDFDLLMTDHPLDVDSELFGPLESSQLVDVNFRFTELTQALPFAWSIRESGTQQKLHIVFILLKSKPLERSSAEQFLEFLTTKAPYLLSRFSQMKTPFVNFEDTSLNPKDKASALREYPLNHLKIEFKEMSHAQ